MREWGSGAIRHIMFLERDESLFVKIARRARVLLTPNADSLLVTAVYLYTPGYRFSIILLLYIHQPHKRMV